MLNPLLQAKLVYVLGITNLLGLLLVFFSCRCLMGPRFAKVMLKIPGYQKFYQTHCLWWYVFFTSVILHVILAMSVYGNPFAR